MRIGLRIPTLLLAAMFVFSLLPLSGTALAESEGDAQLPPWEEGDSWATGFSVNLGVVFADQLEELQAMIENETVGVDLEEFEFSGETALWLVFEVSEKTDTYYILTGSMGQMFTLATALQAVVPVPNNTTATVSIDASIEEALVVNAEARLTNETALESISIEVLASAIVSLEAQNIPMWDLNGTEYEVWYEDYDVEADINLDLEIDMVFDPALDIFDFPIELNETWTVNSTMTTTGTLSGLLDMKGLPEDVEQEILSEDIFVQNNITSFPILFEEISVGGDDGPSVENGVLEPIVVNASASFECIEITTIEHPVLGIVSAYVIQVNDGPKFLYCPDLEFVTSMEIDVSIEEMFDIELPFEPSSNLTAWLDLQMGSANVQEAKEGIESIAEFQSSLASEATNGDEDDLASFFFSPPYFGVIIIVLVVVIIIAAVFAARRKK